MTNRMIALTLLICALWASVGIAIKFCLDSAPPLGLAAVRMLLAAVALWLWMRMRSAPKFDWAAWRVVAVATVFYCMLLAFTHIGFNHTSAARGIVLLNTTPLFVAVLANFIAPREPLNVTKISGLILAFGGVVAIFAPRIDGLGGWAIGDLIMVFAAASWGFHTLWTKRAARDVDPASLNLIQFIGAAVVLSVISIATEPVALWRPTASLVFGIVYLSVVGTVVAWVLWVYVLKRAPASTASSYIFSVPLIGVVMSWLLLGESITLQFALGVILVSVGIVIVNRGAAAPKHVDAVLAARGR
jgi:drug/metabolite transporter (DMT)-like permease